MYKELGDAYLAEKQFQNALSFYTQGIDVKCKDDQLNVKLYIARSDLQRSLGESFFFFLSFFFFFFCGQL